MYKILIVEDDEIIANAIKSHVENWGYTAFCISDFKNVLQDFTSFGPHLVLLDINLPFFNGHHWCNEIRKISKVPIIFISSSSDNMNIVMAMSMGGDDFISKPFDLDVLLAKVQAILRRSYDFQTQRDLIEHQGAILNKSDTTLTYNGERINLTKNDYRILQVLMDNKSKVVSRDFLMEKLWQTDSFVDENTLTVNITRLRKKLNSKGLKNFIITKKGIGYMVE